MYPSPTKNDTKKRVPNDLLEYDDGVMFLDGEPFTGVGFFLDAAGFLHAEIEYRNGLEWGIKRGWHAPDEPAYQDQLFMGVLHGTKREWHRNKRLAEEGDYELGFRLRRKRWDENGNLLEEFELKETDPGYEELEKYRAIYKDDLEREKTRKSSSGT
jgi:antitoxin component YwqK of YwqJK toxin-antitoxin module